MDDHQRVTGAAESGEDLDLRLLRIAGPRRPVPPEREARVRAVVREHWRRNTIAARRSPRMWIAAALTAAAALVVVLVGPSSGPTSRAGTVATVVLVVGEATASAGGRAVPADVGVPLAASTVVETGEGGRVALVLPSGASLRLDVGSRVVLAEADRIRVERGAAYIDSGPARTPNGVVVECDETEVRDVGTQFEVRATGAGVRVRVREGVVVVDHLRRSAVVTAGSEATVGRNGEIATAEIPVFGPEWSWVLTVSPPYRLEGSSAGSFLRWAARETGLRLRWAQPELAGHAERTTLHGDIVGVRPDRAPSLVLPTCGLTARVEEGELLIEASIR